MGLEAWLTLAVVAVVVGLLVGELVSPVAAIIGAVVSLLLLGVLDAELAFAGFSNRATITIAALYVVARAVRATGAVDLLLARVLGPGDGDRRVLARLVAPVSATSAFLNNTPLVATLAPMIRSWAAARSRPPSRYLMPLSFAAILGGLVTTIGTSTTLVVSGLVTDRGLEPFGLFEVTPVGLPAAILGGLAIVLLAPRLLPDRESPAGDVALMGREYTFRLRVAAFGPMDGAAVVAAGLRNLEGVFLSRVDRGGQEIAPVAPDHLLLGGDVLTFVGQVDHVRDLERMAGLESPELEHVERVGADGGHRYYEVVVGATSPLAGQTLKETGFRERYDAAVVAIHRAGERVDAKLGQVQLHVGDVLLVLSDPGFGARWREQRDFLLISEVGARREADPVRSRVVALIVGVMVVLAGAGVVPILHAALGAVVALLVTRVMTVGQARDAVDLDVVLIVAGALGLGNAVETSGLAGVVADGIQSVGGSSGGFAALATVLVGTLVLTELISNTAAAALMVPIALDVADRVGADPRGFAVGVAMMASASFLTPVGYQTNTMVYGLGGYRYLDYWRLGLPITISVLGTTLVAVPIIWSV
ncbi:MAG TPA: SLC13 family permease [Nitriliruptorales bacterium]